MEDITYAAKIGMNINFWSTNATDVGAKIGLQLGGVAEYPINDKFGTQAELLISWQGAKSTSSSNPGRIAITYLAIPLLATYEVIPDLNVHAGIQPSFALSRKQVITSGPAEGKYDAKDDIMGFDFSLVFGGEYVVYEQISAGLRFTIGLNDIGVGGREIKNRVIQIYGKYAFGMP